MGSGSISVGQKTSVPGSSPTGMSKTKSGGNAPDPTSPAAPVSPETVWNNWVSSINGLDIASRNFANERDAALNRVRTNENIDETTRQELVNMLINPASPTVVKQALGLLEQATTGQNPLFNDRRSAQDRRTLLSSTPGIRAQTTSKGSVLGAPSSQATLLTNGGYLK